MKAIPTGQEIVHQALLMIAAAALAAVIVRQLPALRAYLKDSWEK